MCERYVCRDMKGCDVNGNTGKLQAVSETGSEVAKHPEYAGNAGVYCACQGMDRRFLESEPHRPQDQQKQTEVGAWKTDVSRRV